MRPLGANEHIIWHSAQAGCINFVVCGCLSGSINEDTMRAGLRLLEKRHPLIQCRVDTQGTPPVFTSKGVAPIPLKVYPRKSFTDWIHQAEKEVNTPFPCTGPLMRAVLLKDTSRTDILLALHHVIGEGMSSTYLMRDLLQNIADITGGKTPNLTSFPLYPPMEDLLPPHARGLQECIKTIKFLGKLVRIMMQGPVTLTDKNCNQNGYARNKYYMFSQKETETFIAKCHTESTTVHGAVCAALLTAASTFTDQNCPIGCMSPVNMRPVLDPPLGDEVGFYASMVVTAHTVKDVQFWDLARHIKNDVHHAITSGESFVSVKLLDLFIPKNMTSSRLIKRISQVYPVAVLLSNVGKITMPAQYGPYTLEEFHVAIANKAVPHIPNIVILTYQNRLSMTFSYIEPPFSSDQIDTLVRNTINILHRAMR